MISIHISGSSSLIWVFYMWHGGYDWVICGNISILVICFLFFSINLPFLLYLLSLCVLFVCNDHFNGVSRWRSHSWSNVRWGWCNNIVLEPLGWCTFRVTYICDIHNWLELLTILLWWLMIFVLSSLTLMVFLLVHPRLFTILCRISWVVIRE